MKHSEALRILADLEDMVEGTDLMWWDCIRSASGADNTPPMLRLIRDDYVRALGIVEGKPVFAGDMLYFDGTEFVATETNMCNPHCYNSMSWNPPKPKTVMVELLREDVEEMALYECGAITIRNERVREACRKALEKE